DCQKSAGNHRKHAIALRKVQVKCSLYKPINNGSSDSQSDDEQAFNDKFVKNLKILPVKKGQPNFERVIKFVGEKDKELLTEQNDNHSEDKDDDYADTLSSRFTEFLIQHLLKGIKAKNNNVKLRVCHLIAHLIGCLGSIEDDLYECLRVELAKRLLDKEAGVHGDDDYGKDVIKNLIRMLDNDPSAEVRHVDPMNRRGVYMKFIEEINDFRVLSIKDRKKLLNWGLTD
ncbi:11611_t:CDS:2, partial [Scutellospora calospora]